MNEREGWNEEVRMKSATDKQNNGQEAGIERMRMGTETGAGTGRAEPPILRAATTRDQGTMWYEPARGYNYAW